MKIHDLQPPEGSNRGSKRVARGIGGKGGKTAGRGSKGQRARNTVRVGFEGGQNPDTGNGKPPIANRKRRNQRKG